jgi:SAM-dependent methyltransferase
MDAKTSHCDSIRSVPSGKLRESARNDLGTINLSFYETLWSNARLHQPRHFNTWRLIESLLPTAGRRLELGPGLRPRLPIGGTYFLDISATAGRRLHAHGGRALTGTVGALPFRDQTFDLVCACDVVEHVEDDRAVFGEISRVLKDDGAFVLAVPLHRHLWTDFDEWVGHARRYVPAELRSILADHQFALEQSATYGMQPPGSYWMRLAKWYLTHRRTRAMFWYNWVGMPVAMLCQKPLHLVSGLAESPDASEVILVCRRQRRIPC